MGYYAEISQFEALSRKEEIELSERIREGNCRESRNRLVVHNLRFARRIAMGYVGGSLDLDDLVGYANLGLFLAARNYDGQRNSFLSYARPFIKGCVCRAIADYARLVHIPVYLQEDHFKITKVVADFTGDTGRVPTVEEISRVTGFSMMTVRRSNSVTVTWMESISLDDPSLPTKSGKRHDSIDNTIEGAIEDRRVLSPETAAMASQTLSRSKARIQEFKRDLMLSGRALSPKKAKNAERNADIFAMRYGFNSEDSRKYLEDPRLMTRMSEQFQISRQAIDQIIQKMWRDYLRTTDAKVPLDHDSLTAELFRIEDLSAVLESVA